MKPYRNLMATLLLAASPMAGAHVAETHHTGLLDRLMHSVLWEEPRILAGLLVFWILYRGGRRLLRARR